MKELTLKEKAKAYDEAIEKLRSLHDDYDTVSTLIDIKEELENIFPELKESEDERIRKELKALVTWAKSYSASGVTMEDAETMLNWLEKQGEQKPDDKVEDEEYNGEDYGIDSLFHAQRILEKTLGKVDGYQTDDGILAHQCAITAVKKLYEHKSAEWSEEMGKLCLDAIELLRDYASDVDKNSQLGKKIGRADAFLSDLYHDAFYPSTYNMREDLRKAEWSEEDEKERKRIVGLLEGWLSTFKETHYAEDCKCGIDWLESLKPQNHWKPTEEQIRALHDLNLTGNMSYAGQGQVLIELYNDLKKLIE